jgi:hypothetical protein
MIDDKLIFTGKNTPFQTEKAATIQKTRLLNGDPPIKTKVVAVDGGWALQKLFVKSKKRIPLGKRAVLRFGEKDPNYVYRVFNDKPEMMGQRLRDAENAGWEYVRDNKGLEDERAGKTTPMGSTVTKPVGQGTTGVLMKKKKEWYEEDQAEKMAKIDEQEAGLIRDADVDGRYGSIRMKAKRGGKVPR